MKIKENGASTIKSCQYSSHDDKCNKSNIQAWRYQKQNLKLLHPAPYHP